MNKKKLLQNLLLHVHNVKWNDFINLVESFGFTLERVNGSHHIYKHPAVIELLNLQKIDNEAKSYQIKQFLKLIDQYNLSMED